MHKELKKEFRNTAVTKTVLLLINLLCVFLSAIFLSGIPYILNGTSPEWAWRLLGMLALVFGIQILCEFLEKAVWAVKKKQKMNCMELALYRKVLGGGIAAGQPSCGSMRKRFGGMCGIYCRDSARHFLLSNRCAGDFGLSFDV